MLLWSLSEFRSITCVPPYLNIRYSLEVLRFSAFYASALNFVSLKLTASSMLRSLSLNLQVPQPNNNFDQASTWPTKIEAAMTNPITSTASLTYIIDPEGDLTIRLVDKKTTIDPVTERKSEQTTVLATYRVCRKVLTDNSPVFNACLQGWAKEFKQTTVDIEDGTVKSYELWFRILHQDMIDDIDWSPQWVENQKIEKKSLNDMRYFLYVIYELDHIKKFQFITRKLAYGMADHIQEANPSQHEHLHLPSRVLGSLNGARGSLRVKLLKGLFDPINWFIHRHCSCKEVSSYAYITGLSKMGIWPIESSNKKSIQDILNSFDKFVCKVPEKACMECRAHLNSIAINRIRIEIQFNFHGMCLDCMHNSSEGSDKAFDQPWSVELVLVAYGQKRGNAGTPGAEETGV
ncbi:hypothetical protein BOTCAL_1382g00010 [Botryotinia calthae]|uniref:BTB domain-containing protein n=1 Tax=Botryotinia calthae TaxID=38488 RepID=A0A4Y8CEA8_9HELO|nr:hypothetical protein BOTCAL_1382g00010 [Botryotinia calthae]